MHAEIARAIEAMFDAGVPALNDARCRARLGPLEHLLDQFRPAVVELLATSRAFDFPADRLPSHVRTSGLRSATRTGRGGGSRPGPCPMRGPLVAVGFSTTFQNHAGVLQNVIDALATMPARVLVTLGGSIPAGRAAGERELRARRERPHSVVMREAALVVTHGGHGTVMRPWSTARPAGDPARARPERQCGAHHRARGRPGADAGRTGRRDPRSVRAAPDAILIPRRRRRLGDLVAAEAESSSIVPSSKPPRPARAGRWRDPRSQVSRLSRSAGLKSFCRSP